jgi:hypothetical protein
MPDGALDIMQRYVKLVACQVPRDFFSAIANQYDCLPLFPRVILEV